MKIATLRGWTGTQHSKMIKKQANLVKTTIAAHFEILERPASCHTE